MKNKWGNKFAAVVPFGWWIPSVQDVRECYSTLDVKLTQ